MTDIFLTQISIDDMGHLEPFIIKLTEKERHHLILTGKNGSGKTFVLAALYDAIRSGQNVPNAAKSPVSITFNSRKRWEEAWKKQHYLVAFYPANSPAPKDQQSNIEPGDWLATFQQTLQALFTDNTLRFQFDQKKHTLLIQQNNRNFSDFSELPDGYARIASMLYDLMMRVANIDTEDSCAHGIVLIDAIETFLHVDLQKRLLPCLTSLFPGIQFIVSTHSPVVMNSLEHAIVFDLEHQIQIDDLLMAPYEAIIERHDLSQYSDQIKQMLSEYETLLNKKMKTEQEDFRLLELGNYLAWILHKFRQSRKQKS